MNNNPTPSSNGRKILFRVEGIEMNPQDTLTVEGSSDPSATAGGATKGSCLDPEALKTLTDAGNHVVSNFKDGGTYTLGVYKEGFNKGLESCKGYCSNKTGCENGRRCTGTITDPQHVVYRQPTTAAQPEKTRWWMVGAGILGMLVVVGGVVWLMWYLLGNTSTSNSSVPVNVKNGTTLDSAEAALMLNIQKRTLQMNKDYHSSNNVPTQSSAAPQTTHQASNTPSSKSFGGWVVPEPGVVAAVYECITGEAVNLRRYSGSKLDGVDKFDLTASIAATYLVNHFKVIYTEGESPHLENSGSIPDTCSFVTDLAYRAGDRTLHDNPRYDEGSLDWWINSTLQKIPSSDVTDFSNAVRAAINNLDDGLKSTDSEDGLNGVTRVKYDMPEVFASYASTATTTKSGGAKKSAPKGSGLSPVNMKTAPYTDLGYINPIPAGYTSVPNGKFGVWRNTRGGYYHKGEDLSTHGDGHTILQPAPFVGTVISAKWEGDFGNCVRLDIGDAEIIFAHLKFFGPSIRLGAKISQGMEIGKVGSTGESSGPHLHIEFVPKVPNFIVPIFIEEEQAGAYSSGLSRLKIKIYKTKKP